MLGCGADAESGTEKLVNGQTDVARNTAIAAHRAARDLPFGDKDPPITFRCAGVQRDTGMIEHLQQLVFLRRSRSGSLSSAS